VSQSPNTPPTLATIAANCGKYKARRRGNQRRTERRAGGGGHRKAFVPANMPPAGLTAEQEEHFLEHGFTRLPQAFPKPLAEEWAAAGLARLGFDQTKTYLEQGWTTPFCRTTSSTKFRCCILPSSHWYSAAVKKNLGCALMYTRMAVQDGRGGTARVGSHGGAAWSRADRRGGRHALGGQADSQFQCWRRAKMAPTKQQPRAGGAGWRLA
jgi:hypothetical protein